MHKKNRISGYGEAVFDIVYLLIAFSLGIYYIQAAQTRESFVLFGILTLILGLGDAFHLIPRILSHTIHTPLKCKRALGIGKMITSITMTIFYVLLFQLWLQCYPQIILSGFIHVLIYALAFVRILLCILPQNGWATNEDQGKWPIYRNIPFLMLGIILMSLYTFSASQVHDALFWMPVAIFFSFLFYVPVTLFASSYPMVGMLMLPKTMMYIWIIFMGLGLS